MIWITAPSSLEAAEWGSEITTMLNKAIEKLCASVGSKAETLCDVPCSGHGTTCNCPPLIVLAVLSAEQAMLASAAAA